MVSLLLTSFVPTLTWGSILRRSSLMSLQERSGEDSSLPTKDVRHWTNCIPWSTLDIPRSWRRLKMLALSSPRFEMTLRVVIRLWLCLCQERQKKERKVGKTWSSAPWRELLCPGTMVLRCKDLLVDSRSDLRWVLERGSLGEDKWLHPGPAGGLGWISLHQPLQADVPFG